VDPYGDTLFNEQEVEAALREVAVLSQQCADGRQKAAPHDRSKCCKAAGAVASPARRPEAGMRLVASTDDAELDGLVLYSPGDR
jgi:hypothetical protein